jgi:hypothetical protein
VLEKLGVINKESGTLDQTAAKANAAAQSGGCPGGQCLWWLSALSSAAMAGYQPVMVSRGEYQGYRPVTAPAGRSYVDQSKNDYHINVQGGAGSGTNLDRQLQDALEKYERDKRARNRSSMMHDE